MEFIFNKLQTVFYEKFSFHYDQVQLETQLELELGMDSREMFEVLTELEKTFQITIDFDELNNGLVQHKVLRIKDLVEYINKKQEKPKELNR